MCVYNATCIYASIFVSYYKKGFQGDLELILSVLVLKNLFKNFVKVIQDFLKLGKIATNTIKKQDRYISAFFLPFLPFSLCLSKYAQ